MCWKGEASAIKCGKRYKPFFRIISTSSPPLLPTMHWTQWTFCHVWMMLHNLARKLGIPFEGINFEGGLMSTPPSIILYVVKFWNFLRWMMKVAECGSSRNTTKSCKSHSSKSQVGLTYQFCKEAQILMQCIHLHCWASQMYHPNLDRGMALWSPQSGRHDRESWRQTPTRFTFYFSLLQKPEISKSKDNDNIYTEDITEQTLKSFIFASRRDFCRTQRQYWICRSFLMSRSIAIVCTLQRFPKRGNSSQFIALLTGLRPSILPTCLILAQFTAQGDLTQQIIF